MNMYIEIDSDEVSKVVVAAMHDIIEIMSKDPVIPFVSADPKEDMKYRKKMTKAAHRVLKWHSVPLAGEGWDD
jgi:5'-deoxynucleotidase YfbR-like HD superfamily hydrolase